jgi:hypothetical protein
MGHTHVDRKRRDRLFGKFLELVNTRWQRHQTSSPSAMGSEEHALLGDLIVGLASLFPHRFSHPFLDEKLRASMHDLSDKGSTQPRRDEVADVFDELLRELSEHHETWIVTVPVENLELGLDHLQVGKVTLRQDGCMTHLSSLLGDAFEAFRSQYPFVKARAEVEEDGEYVRAMQQGTVDVHMALNALCVWDSPARTKRGKNVVPSLPSVIGETSYRRRFTYAVPKSADEDERRYPPYAASGEIVGGLSPVLVDNDLLATFRRLGFDRLCEILAADRPDDMGKRVLRAVRWMGEARRTGNLDDAFVKNSIALETLLLGDGPNFTDPKTSIGSITSQLAERAAFLLGRHGQERERVAGDVRRLYAIRSSIVHRGASVEEEDLTRWELYIIHCLAALLILDFGGFDTLRDWTKHFKFSGEPPSEEPMRQPLWHSLYAADEEPDIW